MLRLRMGRDQIQREVIERIEGRRAGCEHRFVVDRIVVHEIVIGRVGFLDFDVERLTPVPELVHRAVGVFHHRGVIEQIGQRFGTDGLLGDLPAAGTELLQRVDLGETACRFFRNVLFVLLGPHAVNPGQAVEVVADVEGARSDLDFLQSGQFLVHATEFSVVCDRGSLRMQFLEYRCFTVYCSQIDLQRGLPPGLGIERKGDESGQKEHPAYRREDVQPRFERSVLPDGHGEFGRSVPDDRRVERDFDPVEKAGIVARNRSCDPGRAVADDGCGEIFRQRGGFLVFFCESRTARLRFFAR